MRRRSSQHKSNVFRLLVSKRRAQLKSTRDPQFRKIAYDASFSSNHYPTADRVLRDFPHGHKDSHGSSLPPIEQLCCFVRPRIVLSSLARPPHRRRIARGGKPLWVVDFGEWNSKEAAN